MFRNRRKFRVRNDRGLFLGTIVSKPSAKSTTVCTCGVEHRVVRGSPQVSIRGWVGNDLVVKELHPIWFVEVEESDRVWADRSRFTGNAPGAPRSVDDALQILGLHSERVRTLGQGTLDRTGAWRRCFVVERAERCALRDREREGREWSRCRCIRGACGDHYIWRRVPPRGSIVRHICGASELATDSSCYDD